jgi:hypothetical protein
MFRRRRPVPSRAPHGVVSASDGEEAAFTSVALLLPQSPALERQVSLDSVSLSLPRTGSMQQSVAEVAYALSVLYPGGVLDRQATSFGAAFELSSADSAWFTRWDPNNPGQAICFTSGQIEGGPLSIVEDGVSSSRVEKYGRPGREQSLSQSGTDVGGNLRLVKSMDAIVITC